jgi:DNA-binding MarR family transcriptional regulator
MGTRGPRRKPSTPPSGAIVSEIRQTRPFASLEREASVTLLRTGDVLRHAVESALRPWGLSPEQYNVLRILKGADEQGLPTLEIAERMLARSPNITRLIDKMDGKGLAQRRHVEGDRRVVLVSATPQGRKLLEDLDRAIEAMLAKLSSLEASQLRTLVELLDAVRQRLAVPTVREGLARKQKKG